MTERRDERSLQWHGDIALGIAVETVDRGIEIIDQRVARIIGPGAVVAHVESTLRRQSAAKRHVVFGDLATLGAQALVFIVLDVHGDVRTITEVATTGQRDHVTIVVAVTCATGLAAKFQTVEVVFENEARRRPRPLPSRTPRYHRRS